MGMVWTVISRLFQSLHVPPMSVWVLSWSSHSPKTCMGNSSADLTLGVYMWRSVNGNLSVYVGHPKAAGRVQRRPHQGNRSRRWMDVAIVCCRLFLCSVRQAAMRWQQMQTWASVCSFSQKKKAVKYSTGGEWPLSLHQPSLLPLCVGGEVMKTWGAY